MIDACLFILTELCTHSKLLRFRLQKPGVNIIICHRSFINNLRRLLHSVSYLFQISVFVIDSFTFHPRASVLNRHFLNSEHGMQVLVLVIDHILHSLQHPELFEFSLVYLLIRIRIRNNLVFQDANVLQELLRVLRLVLQVFPRRYWRLEVPVLYRSILWLPTWADVCAFRRVLNDFGVSIHTNQ